MEKITIGSLFSGIGGFELGLERGIPNSKTIWQVEQNKYCQSILRKHWKKAIIHSDIFTVGSDNLQTVDVICGGFPCQDISVIGNKKGIQHGKKSSLWFEMHRVIKELRPKIAIIENVAGIRRNEIEIIVNGLSEIGYDVEWVIISAEQFGALHQRKRFFAVAYTPSRKSRRMELSGMDEKKTKAWKDPFTCEYQAQTGFRGGGYWARPTLEPPFLHVADGVSDRLARLKALGNAIVPQCSEWVGRQIYKSGLLQFNE